MLQRPLPSLRALSCVAFVLLFASSRAQTDSINVGGLERTYTVRLPSAYDGVTPLPLVIAMHGGFGSGLQLEQQSLLTVKGEEAGFIVVYPDGVASPLGIRSWNAGWCCGYSSTNSIDDVGFIDSLLDTLENELAIDTLRIYATGMSNGGFLSYRLACELSDRIAAIAPVAASMSMTDCAPARSMPVIAFHSYLDESVPYLGGIGTGISAHYNPPLDSVQNAFASHAACAVLNDTLQDDVEMTVISWHECDCAQEVLTYMTHDGGHSWPGGVQSPIGDPTSTVIDADDLMWAFFQQYTLDCALPAGAPALPGLSGLAVYPNPTADAWRVVLPVDQGATRLRLFDAMGRAVRTITIPAGQRGVTVTTEGLAHGTYLLRTSNAQDDMQRLMVVE
ncbi:MAG: PHB depolymerase family esterase [Flavobacteriales bacterium]